MKAFRAAIGKAKTEWFDDKYGEKQLYLGMLACHPDYQKRGAGEILVRWGIDKAKAEELTVTLFASPMGTKLYSRMGFKDIGSFPTQVEVEKEVLVTPGMVLELDSL
jgi:predicted N-acetyltransferase YhbS